MQSHTLYLLHVLCACVCGQRGDDHSDSYSHLGPKRACDESTPRHLVTCTLTCLGLCGSGTQGRDF